MDRPSSPMDDLMEMSVGDSASFASSVIAPTAPLKATKSLPPKIQSLNLTLLDANKTAKNVGETGGLLTVDISSSYVDHDHAWRHPSASAKAADPLLRTLPSLPSPTRQQSPSRPTTACGGEAGAAPALVARSLSPDQRREKGAKALDAMAAKYKPTELVVATSQQQQRRGGIMLLNPDANDKSMFERLQEKTVTKKKPTIDDEKEVQP